MDRLLEGTVASQAWVLVSNFLLGSKYLGTYRTKPANPNDTFSREDEALRREKPKYSLRASSQSFSKSSGQRHQAKPIYQPDQEWIELKREKNIALNLRLQPASVTVYFTCCQKGLK
jgi:hypothetical protein